MAKQKTHATARYSKKQNTLDLNVILAKCGRTTTTYSILIVLFDSSPTTNFCVATLYKIPIKLTAKKKLRNCL